MPILLGDLAIGCVLTGKIWARRRSSGCCCAIPDVTEVAVYAVPDPVVGDQVMAALVMAPGSRVRCREIPRLPGRAARPGPKQWPSYVRVSAELPRTVTFKVLKRQLSAEGVDCADPVWPHSPVRHDLRPLELALKRASNSFRRECRPPLVRDRRAGRSALFIGSSGRPESPGRPSRSRWRSRRCAAIDLGQQDWLGKVITESDNPASEALWSQLGEPADAAPAGASRDRRKRVTRPRWSNHVDFGGVSPHSVKRSGPWTGKPFRRAAAIDP